MATKGFSSIRYIYGFSVFGGISLGVSMTALVVTSQLAAPPELIASASALMLTTRRVWSIIGIAIWNAILNGLADYLSTSSKSEHQVWLGRSQESL